jgi:hypothetical protein
MTIDTTDWKYYYKLQPDGTPSATNLLYTPTMNADGTMLCMHYCSDPVYRNQTSAISEDVITWFFDREVRFLKEFSHLESTPTVYDIDTANRKIIIEWNTETLSQIVFDPNRNLDQELVNWQEKIGKILKDIKKENCWKMSLYPHCFYISTQGHLKTIDYYSVVPYSERFIDREIIEEIIGPEGAYRFDESTEDGKIDFKKFFKITLTQHLNNFWPNLAFHKLFKEVTSND